MPETPDGRFYIYNKKSGFWLRSEDKGAGELLVTVPKPAKKDPSYVFVIDNVRGKMVSITSESSGLIAGISDETGENTPITWRRGKQLFELIPVGTDGSLFRIKLTTDNFFWYDSKKDEHKYATVLLTKSGASDDSRNWALETAD